MYFLIDLQVIHDIANNVSAAIKMQHILSRIFSLDNKPLKVNLVVGVTYKYSNICHTNTGSTLSF